ncbi:glycolate oxidase FAD binding subunit [Rhodoligotrophos appendicifer]|uniref:glycolate oxidase subunit GlcE n=1 Tax=Rhodoligotrophos appendicifer TaxID=987056 RepID=UPI0011868302|nr:glycolate oxidase subunit GlcE [Rhodoligotrophos appendicifer]
MASVLKPENLGQLRDAVAWAASAQAPIEILGSGSKRAIGGVMDASWTLDTTALSGISLYEPEELVIQAGSGTPLEEITAAITARGQCLAFEPPDLTVLLGGNGGPGTAGGLVATNLAGPRRIKVGAVRDHFLGFKAVSGRGEIFKGGGRVVKNVTGYDLPKLMAGSWGTLAVMSEVTLKVLPAPETESSLILFGLDDEAAIAALSAGLGSACEISGAAHIPVDLARRFAPEDAAGQGASVTAFRLEGVGPSVAYRVAKLEALVAVQTASLVVEAEPSRALWGDIRDGLLLADRFDRPVWRISVAPARGAAVLNELRRTAQARGFYDWGGGLIWCDVAATADAGASSVRGCIARHGGHATLIRADAATRAAVASFDPLSPGIRALTRRVKAGFDPHGILNPGRMYDGS